MKKLILIAIFTITAFCSYGKDKPNIILFLVDDMGWTDAATFGSTYYQTPNIDRLAEEGVKFTSAYVSHPRCVPSRYAIVTGNYPARAKMPGAGEGKLIAGDESNLHRSDKTVAEALKGAGYNTFFTGKWHLASAGTYPQDVGFDINVAGGEAGSPISYFYPYNIKTDRYGNVSETKTKKKDNGKHKAPIDGLEDGEEGEYLTDRITAETLKFIDKQSDNTPFFAMVSHYGIHQPIEAPKDLVDQFIKSTPKQNYSVEEFIPEGTGTTKTRQDNPIYGAMIKSIDKSLGDIVKALEDKGISDNTIILFFSDNGGLSNRGYNPRSVATSNLPLRAGKGHLYEGGIRVPMIAKWPNHIKKNRVTDQIVQGTDLYPTFVDIAGGEISSSKILDGVSFKDLLLADNDLQMEERSIFWHSPVDRPHATGDSNSSAIRKGDYKLIDFYDSGVVELYNIKLDIEEKFDISNKEPEIKAAMLKELREWRLDVDAYIKPIKKRKSK